jgi:hypothetical protein
MKFVWKRAVNIRETYTRLSVYDEDDNYAKADRGSTVAVKYVKSDVYINSPLPLTTSSLTYLQ